MEIITNEVKIVTFTRLYIFEIRALTLLTKLDYSHLTRRTDVAKPLDTHTRKRQNDRR